MDSILWFHLECPKARDKFDDPVEFRIKWRDWFAERNADAKNLFNESDELKRIRKEFDAHIYPEDIQLRPQA